MPKVFRLMPGSPGINFLGGGGGGAAGPRRRKTRDLRLQTWAGGRGGAEVSDLSHRRGDGEDAAGAAGKGGNGRF